MQIDELDKQSMEKLLKVTPDSEKAFLISLFDELNERKRVRLCEDDFLTFIAAIDVNYKFGKHLQRLGSLLMDVEKGYKEIGRAHV